MTSDVLPQCPHGNNLHPDVGEIARIRKQVKCCQDCKYSGPNLWVCLQEQCLRIGCSEQANDHSTLHFQENPEHCVHINISSQRLWCYICEREIFLNFKLTIESKLFNGNSCSSGITSGGLVGLQNIANTCYMNSALQALSNVPPMTQYFLNCSDIVDHIINCNAHRHKAGLAKSYQRLIKSMWCKVESDKDYIAPRSILYGIRSINPMFRGYQQHDTQEFLRCFMDQLHEELKEVSPSSPFHNLSSNYSNFNNNDNMRSTSPVGNTETLSDSEYESCDGSMGLAEQSTLYIRQSKKYNGMYKEQQFKKTRSPQYENVNPMQQQNVMRSIISDIFDGKLLSSVQCLTCDRVSSREETFQDLSLPIPNRDYLNILHSNNKQPLNVTESSTTPTDNNDGWIAWIWNIVRSWLWGPSVTLYDCMASLFSADELKGDNMYSCEKCNKLRTGIKYAQILELPEVICIHLKRFRHDLSYSSKISSHVQFPIEGLEMRSYLHSDCKSSISTYNLVSVICHHGTVGGGHYTCFAKNDATKQWYEYDDHHVTPIATEVVQNCQAYVLFYRKSNRVIDKIRREANELSELNPVDLVNIRFYVPREWILRFNTFAEPGPINNWSILCPHGGLLHTKSELISQIAVPISQALWDFLYGRFGGGPVINMLFECETCKRTYEALARRQYYELSVFTKYNELDIDDSGEIFAISMQWLRKWQNFARSVTSIEPGPITNNDVVLNIGKVQTTLLKVRPGSDYAQINGLLWRFLHGIYGGGPEILLRGSLKRENEITNRSSNFDAALKSNVLGIQRNIEANGQKSLFDKEYYTGKGHKRKNCLSNLKTTKVAIRNGLNRKNYRNRKLLKNYELIATKENDILYKNMSEQDKEAIQEHNSKVNDGMLTKHRILYDHIYSSAKNGTQEGKKTN